MHAGALISIRGDICVFLLNPSELEILFWWSAEQWAWVERKSVDCSVWRTGDYVYCGRGGRRNNYQTDCFPRWAPLGLYNSLEVSCYLASSYTHWLWQPRLHPHPSPPRHKFTYGAHCGFHNYKSGREEEVCLSNTTSLPSHQIL